MVARTRWRSVLGLIMTLMAGLGFLTVADDLRHVGELLGVSALLVAGITLVVDGLQVAMFHRIDLYWVSVGVLVGAVAGVPSDHMGIGMGAGFSVGLAVGLLRGRRRRQGS